MSEEHNEVVREIKKRGQDRIDEGKDERLKDELEAAAKPDVPFPGTKADVERALAPLAPPAPLAVPEDIVLDEDRVKRAFALSRMIADVVMTKMDRGIHYAIIPGTQQEALLDPGASTLMSVTRSRPRHTILDVREEEDGHIVVIMAVDLVYTPAGGPGLVVATGIGATSTHETKYAYRWVPEDELPTGIDKTTLKQRTRQHDTYYRIPNPDLGDLWNTLVKMAAKRAEVDAAQHLPGVAEALARIRQRNR